MTTLATRVGYVPPMEPSLVDRAPEGDRWIHELKYDGYRTQIAINGDRLSAFTKNGADWTDRYTSLLEAARALDCSAALIDGEVIVQDENGLSDFHALKAMLDARKPRDLVFMAFDLLHLDGEDLRSLPVEERRARLRALMGANEPGRPLQFSDHVVGGGSDFFRIAEQAGAEGIVSKRLGSRYVSGATRSWQKTKAFALDEFVVIGASKGDLAPVALLARETEDHRLEYAGSAMVTFDEADRERFWRAHDRLKTEKPPLHMEPRKETTWMKPEMRVRVRHLRGERMLRHATVKAITHLPAAPAPISAKPPAAARPPSQEPTYRVGADAVPPLDLLLDYYGRLAPAMLPYVGNRPLNLFRCDREGECVFQRSRAHPYRPASLFPPPIRDIPILQKNGRTERYLYVDDIEGILTCIAVSEAVEFHGWGSRVEDLEKPDRIAIDLDPDEGLGFEEVKRAAFQVRDGLEAIGLESFPLLTGGKGVHVVLPLTPAAEWSQVHAFSRDFCAALAGAEPDRFTIESRMAKRRGRIFLDYLRNHRTGTAVLPYSVRARPGGPVAAPVTWTELSDIDTPRAFTAADSLLLVKRARRLKRWGMRDQSLPMIR